MGLDITMRGLPPLSLHITCVHLFDGAGQGSYRCCPTNAINMPGQTWRQAIQRPSKHQTHLLINTLPACACRMLSCCMLAVCAYRLPATLATAEPAEADIMQRPPRRPGKRLLGKLILWRCAFVSGLLVILVLGMYGKCLCRRLCCT
jgi:hypothetical protein